jgi:hypothetical protein
MINPEFKRNLWLSFSRTKMVGMPAVLSLIFLAIYVTYLPQSFFREVHTTSITLFGIIVWLWGASNASAAILDEIRNKTWDQQRMSALAPWSMTWGKLFGATAFNWYGGAICLCVIALTAPLVEGEPHLAITLLTLCAIAVLLHAAMIASNLYVSQFGTRPLQNASVGWVIVSIIVLKFLFDFRLDTAPTDSRLWWGMEIDHALFWLFTALLFAFCFVFAAWRAMCSALQVRTLPWAWPAFALILTVYFTGQLPEEPGRLLPSLMIIGLLVSVVLTYFALFAEANTLLRWRKLRILQQKKDWRGWFEQLPVWVTTLALSMGLALLIYLYVPAPPEWRRSVEPHPLHAFALVLMLLRDVCIVLFFDLSPNNKNAAAKSVFYLLLLDMLLPYLASVMNSHLFLFLVLPVPLLPGTSSFGSWGSVLVMAVHAAIAMVLINLRLRTARRQ